MPKTTTCFDPIFKGSKARDCFSCTVLIPGSLVAGNQTYRIGLSHFLQLHKKVSWLLPCPVGFAVRSFQAHHPARFHSLTEPKVHSQPLYVLAREATGCVTDFCCHKPRLISCHVKILHCATWRYHALQIAPACGTRALHSLSLISF